MGVEVGLGKTVCPLRMDVALFLSPRGEGKFRDSR